MVDSYKRVRTIKTTAEEKSRLETGKENRTLKDKKQKRANAGQQRPVRKHRADRHQQKFPHRKHHIPDESQTKHRNGNRKEEYRHRMRLSNRSNHNTIDDTKRTKQ